MMQEQSSSDPAKQPSRPKHRLEGGSGLRTAQATRQPAGSAVTSDPTDWFPLVMKEYKYLQAAIDKIDGQRFQIRNWAIVAAGALFTASLSAKIPLTSGIQLTWRISDAAAYAGL